MAMNVAILLRCRTFGFAVSAESSDFIANHDVKEDVLESEEDEIKVILIYHIAS